jgi:hypothetical protein
LVNNITESSLVANQITLPAGIYYSEGFSLAFRVAMNQTRLMDITNTETLLIGTPVNARTDGGTQHASTSFFSGKFELENTAIIESQHIVATTSSADGGGIAAGFDEINIYSDLKIWKVA